jgi:4-alpha-glucanotransferase
MNTPGTIGHNWEWRYEQKALNKSIKIKFKNITKETKRI